MAGYRGHLTFAGIVAVTEVATLSVYTPIKDVNTLGGIFLLTLIGSLLPDIDSDSGLPFFLSYGTFTLAAMADITYHTLLLTQDVHQRIYIPIAAFIILWFVVGKIIKRFTHHRGIFHSIPMLGVLAFATVLEATKLEFHAVQATLLGAAIGAGFLSHLVLDEIYALFGINSYLFVPNKAFGTALKLWSDSGMATILCYVLLFVLFYFTQPTLTLALPLISPYIAKNPVKS